MLISAFWATSWQFFRIFFSISRNFAKCKICPLPTIPICKKPSLFRVNCFLQDDASASIQSLQTSIKIKLYQNLWNGLYRHLFWYSVPPSAQYTWLYNNISVNQCKCFEIPQCFTCMMIVWFYAILRVFVLYSHYDYNISSKKLNAHRLWNPWASKADSFFFWNITFHNHNNY